MMLRSASVLVTVAALVAHAGPARAVDGATAAREAYAEARRDYRLGHFAEALAGVEKAYRLSDDPALLFNLGQTHAKLGHVPEASRGDGRQRVHLHIERSRAIGIVRSTR